MIFEKHLFISYAHIDNLPTPDDKQGWVTRFHQYLETYLSQSMGRQANIWRDDKLRGDDIFANEITNQFSKTAILLSILSPRYLASTWCLREVSEFCKTAEQTGGVSINDKARVMRAMLKRIPTEARAALPEILRSALGYEFFQATEGARDLPLDPSFGSGADYRRQIYFLAEDIAELIDKIEKKESGKPAEEVRRRTVYLAECGYDMRESRELIRGELRGQGYIVSPDQAVHLPDTETEYRAAVLDLLGKADLAVHFVGASPGRGLDGPGRQSVVQLQNELAAETSKSNGLPRVIWLPDEMSAPPADQQGFIRDLQRVADLQFGADLITSDLERLKGAILDCLQRLDRPDVAVGASPNPNKQLHLICDPTDRPTTIALRKFLKSRGLNVSIPVFEGDAASTRRANEESLKECDAVLLFYGAGSEAWKRTVDKDVIKARGYRSRNRPLGFYTYLSPPLTDDKNELIELGELNLIDGLKGFAERDLDPFLSFLEV